MVPIPAGEHVVEIRFTGTWPLWLCGLVSGTAWTALAAGGLLRQTTRGQTWLEACRKDLGKSADGWVAAWRRAAITDTEVARVWRRLGGVFLSASIILRLVFILFPIRDPWWSAAIWPMPLYVSGSILLVVVTWRLVAVVAGSERTACLAVILCATANEFLYYARLRLPFDWSLTLVLGAMLAAVSVRTPLAALGAGMIAALSSVVYDGYTWSAAVFVVTGIVLGVWRRSGQPAGTARLCMAALAPVLITTLLHQLGLWAPSPWNPTGVPTWRWDLHVEFLRLSEGFLPVIWVGGTALAAGSSLNREGPRWLGVCSGAAGILGLGIYLLTGLFPIHASQGDVIRPLVWLACVLTAWSLDCIWRHGPAGRVVTVCFLILIGGLAAPGIARLFAAVTPERFAQLASVEVARLRGQGMSGTFRIESRSRGTGNDQPWTLEDTGFEAETVTPQPPHGQVLRLLKTPSAKAGSTMQQENIPESGPGAVRLTLQLPAKSRGAEPLITTGVTGQGDFLYLIQDSDRSVRLGFDHWGVGGKVSEPLSIDPAKPLTIEASLGSLYPAKATAERRGWLLVRVNGSIVWSEPAEFYAAPPGTIRFGANPIGGSTTSEIFSGDILQLHSLNEPELGALFAAP